MINVLVTGKNSQLAQSIKDYEVENRHINFEFKNTEALDITNKEIINKLFKHQSFDYCINCAAYTNVEKAEDEPQMAYLLNSLAVSYLAISCEKYNVTLIHISTDFVFDGYKNKPYLDIDVTNPLNVYGKSKRSGEISIENICNNYFIVRTSWLYSKYKKNFLKTIIDLAQIKNDISVIDNQFGSPTNAHDLAHFLITIINSKSKVYGIYNFSNKGIVSWYGFSKKIVSLYGLKAKITPIKLSLYNLKATRPKYSALDVSKTERVFNFKIKSWDKSLEEFIHQNNSLAN